MPSPSRHSPRPADRPAKGPLQAAPTPTPAVAGLDRTTRQRMESRRQWRRAWIYLVVAALLHTGIILWLRSLSGELPEPLPELIVHSTLEEELPLEPELPEEIPPPEMKPPEPPPIDEPEFDDPTVDEMDDDLLLSTGEDSNALGLGGGQGVGGRGGKRSGLASGAALELGEGRRGSGFGKFVEDLRERGMDVVFVVDATASMEKVIELTRTTIDQIIGELGAIVPDLRLGLTAYRDRGDQWLTQQVALTDDRYTIHNFLIDLEASGGGDFEEAVEVGLQVAIENSGWRESARLVLILVGDAPPHEDDEQKAIGLVRSFVRGKDAAVSVLFTGSSPGKKPTAREAGTLAVFERIVRAGGGHLAELGTDGAELRERILDASFGEEWREDIRELLGNRKRDWRERIVERKVESRDRKWLLQNLSDTPVHPAIVEACVKLFDRRVADWTLALLIDESKPRSVRSVALYVLKKSVARTISIDVTQPLEAQASALAALKREIDRLPKAPPIPRGR